jgi:hypothetical protein
LAAFLVAQELAAAFGAEYEVNDDVGEGLGHEGDAPTGLEMVVGMGHLGLRSRCSLQPRLSHDGPLALKLRRNSVYGTAYRAESPYCDSPG